MSKLTTTKQPPTLEERYKLLNRLVDAALLVYHPDHYRGDQQAGAEKLTRKLIVTKNQARKMYEELKP